MLLRELQVTQAPSDELWAFIGERQKRVRPDDDATKGDAYIFLALMR